ncbi:hypothetical protein ACF0H5_020335 [Mactra antiquata]
MSRTTDTELLQVVPSLHILENLSQADQNLMIGENDIKAGRSSSTQSDDDNDYDILDLERLTHKFENEMKEKIEQFLRDVDGDIYIKMNDETYEKIKENDRQLEKSYDLLYQYGMEKFPLLEKQTEDMIDRLEKEPHLYCPFKRHDTTEQYVNRWLYDTRNVPMPELHGFSGNDPYDLEKFIPSFLPRVSNSDTNVAGGKRKRDDDDGDYYNVVVDGDEEEDYTDDNDEDGDNDDDDDDNTGFIRSSSDSRLVCNPWYRRSKRIRRT